MSGQSGPKGFKYRVIAVFLAALGAFVMACGGDHKLVIPPEPDDLGTGATSGGGRGTVPPTTTSGRGGAGGTGGNTAPPVAGAGPVVKVTSPAPSDDPNKGPVLYNDGKTIKNNQVTAVCTATAGKAPGAMPVDGSTVRLEMLDASDKSLQALTGTPNPTNSSEYSAQFVFTKVPNGKISFKCSAKDRSGATGTDTVSTFVDHGPDIATTEPEADSAHPLATLAVEFNVTPAPLSSKDDGAAVDTVTLAINGVDVDLGDAVDRKDPTHYKLSVDLTDRSLFQSKLDGSIAISITATDTRGVTQTQTYHFLVDSTGPVITITAPKDQEIIGGTRLLEFTVLDTAGSGVNRDSIVVTVNQDSHSYDTKGLWTVSSDGTKFTFAIDSAVVAGATVSLNINVTASDEAGNMSNAGRTLFLDTMPPSLDLDPPKLQEVKIGNNGMAVCSVPFDPLGATRNDGDVVAQNAQIRALVWDEYNSLQDQSRVVFAGVDQDPNSGAVKLYVQGDPSAGLLVDTDGDNVCDELDTTLAFKPMIAIAPTGSADYTPSTDITGVCVSGTDANPPDKLCGKTSDLSRVIQHYQLGGPSEAVIYGLEASKGECIGNDLQLSTMKGVTKNGWVCLAVRAEDKTGNVNVSAPLRLCLDDPTLGATPACATMSTMPPSCTTDCKAPPHFLATLKPPYVYRPN